MGNVFFYHFEVKSLKKGITIGITANSKADGEAITGVFFGSGKQKTLPKKIAQIGCLCEAGGFVEAETPLIQQAAAQIAEYLAGARKEFSLPLALHGTDFQKAVWQALQKIPFGETRSYKDIAVMIGRPKAVRAVGMANNRNPISIIVPCHRVIGHDGSLVGYGGGLPLKEYLLNLEKGGGLQGKY